MILTGQNLYRVTFKLTGVSKMKEVELTRLVVAYSEKEASAYIGSGVTLVQPLEMDVSMIIPDQYLRTD